MIPKERDSPDEAVLSSLFGSESEFEFDFASGRRVGWGAFHAMVR
jgi:hypothetical protein